MPFVRFVSVPGTRGFGSIRIGLDKATRAASRGQRVTEVLKQPQYSPLPLHQEVEVIYAAVNGYLDSVPISELQSGKPPFTASWTPAIQT